MWQVHSQGPFEQKPIKNYGEKESWADPGTDHFFGGGEVTAILSQERVKIRTSNIVRTFIGSIGTKAR